MAFMLQESALQAAEGLRGDPLFYFVVVGLLSIVVALGGVVAFLFKKNSELQHSLMDLSKAGTEAISALMPVVMAMKDDQRESLRRFEQQVERAVSDIKGHINVLRQLNP